MLPHFKPGQKIIALQWFTSIKPNDIVIAEVRTNLMIKRIIKIEQNKLWLEGDNKEESTDSRKYGWVNRSQIIAKVLFPL